MGQVSTEEDIDDRRLSDTFGEVLPTPSQAEKDAAYWEWNRNRRGGDGQRPQFVETLFGPVVKDREYSIRSGKLNLKLRRVRERRESQTN